MVYDGAGVEALPFEEGGARFGAKGTCCLRLDHVLPSKEQEEKGERPLARLVGLAVGPVQGMMEGEGRRRWRVVLTYADRSTLIYELGGEGAGESLESMVI